MNTVIPVPTLMRIKYTTDGGGAAQENAFNYNNVNIDFTAPTHNIVERYYPAMPNFPIVLYSNKVILYNYFALDRINDDHFKISIGVCPLTTVNVSETKIFCNVDPVRTAANINFFPIVEDPCTAVDMRDAPVSSKEIMYRIKEEMKHLAQGTTCPRQRKRKLFDFKSEPLKRPSPSPTPDGSSMPEIKSEIPSQQTTSSSRRIYATASQDVF